MTKNQRLRVIKTKNFSSLKNFYEQLNKKLFFNLLNCPNIRIVKSKRFLAAFHFRFKNKKTIECEILFNEKFFLYSSQKKFTDALIHEMCHQFCAEILNRPFEAHGSIWKIVYRSCIIK